MSDQRGDYETHLSSYGGHPLDKVAGVDPSVVAALQAHGIDDAEHVMAIASLDEPGTFLKDIVAGAGGDLEKLVKTIRKDLPPAMTMLAEATPIGVLSLGVLPPTDEVIQEIQAMQVTAPMEFEAVALPGSVNHAKNMPPVRQQGSRGTCVAFAMTAVHEFYRKMSGTPQDFSEQFLYHQTKLIDGAPAACGTWQVKAAQVLANIGEARENIWSYNPNLPCNNNGVRPANALADAANYRITPIVLGPRDVAAIKSALAGGCCVGFSVPVFNSWYQNPYTRQTGKINMPLGAESSDGGHAMCFIGYQDDASAPGGGFFILRNSWGTGWGAQSPYGAGNGTIPYGYIAAFGWEAVTTPVPRRRRRPDWRRRWPFFPFGEEGGEAEGEGRPTIVIDTGGAYDIIIK